MRPFFGEAKNQRGVFSSIRPVGVICYSAKWVGDDEAYLLAKPKISEEFFPPFALSGTSVIVQNG
jgi:hypothetical protein